MATKRGEFWSQVTRQTLAFPFALNSFNSLQKCKVSRWLLSVSLYLIPTDWALKGTIFLKKTKTELAEGMATILQYFWKPVYLIKGFEADFTVHLLKKLINLIN